MKEMESVRNAAKRETRELDRSLVPAFDPVRVALLDRFDESMREKKAVGDFEALVIGFDLGTTNLVLTALNERGEPVAAIMEPSESSVRDGVVFDYMALLHGVKKALERLQAVLGGRDLTNALGAAAFPPGIDLKTAKVCANVVESAGFDCKGLYEEPTAAACALSLQSAAIVDIGGGTTGITVISGGKPVYTADEPTGGTHMTLVLAGNRDISFESAEKMKRDPTMQRELFPFFKPVLEKMGTIVRRHLECEDWWGRIPVVLCGGGAYIFNAEETLSSVIGLPVTMAPHPLLVTPAGIARKAWSEIYGG